LSHAWAFVVSLSTLANMKNAEQGSLGQLLAWTAAVATLIVLPGKAFDPINVPKLLIIAVGGCMAVGALIAQRKALFQPKYRMVQIFSAAFIIDLTLVLLIAGTNFNQEFFGTFGRATGFIAYFSLCALLLAGVVASSKSNLKLISWSLITTGALSIGYGLLQGVNADPLKWVLKYNPVIGFLGNPNFQSSFIGINAVLVFSLFLHKQYKIAIRALLLLDFFVSFYVIKSTDSQQGFLVALGGVVIVGLMWINKNKLRFLSIPAAVLSLVGGAVVALGTLNKGPLSSLLYKESVTYRGDYWQAGWKMTVEHPFFGVGLDSYGDWYRRARTLEATLRRGPEVVSNAAHNVLLDLSSNGGFPLVGIYLFMVVLVIASSFKVFKRTQEFDPIFSGLFAVWIAYQAQSVISLNQIGLAVWGWIISGLLIGYEINTHVETIVSTDRSPQKKGRIASSVVRQKISAGVVVGMFLGGLVGLGLGLPPLIATTKYMKAVSSQNPEQFKTAAYVSPLDASNMFRVIDTFINNNLMAEALAVSNDSIKSFKDEFGVWEVRSRIEGLSESEKRETLAQMKRLDPNNPNLK
jgi:O-antigen ligase